MSGSKTKATALSADSYLAAITDASRRRDCVDLLSIMSQATQQPPVMWGPSIVGFGVHKYPLAGGKEGDICAVGFSSRKACISIYGVARAPGAEPLLARLGKHKLGKGCLYVNSLDEVDTSVLHALVVRAYGSKSAGEPRSLQGAPQ